MKNQASSKIVFKQVDFNANLAGAELANLVENGEAFNTVYNIFSRQVAYEGRYKKLPSFEEWYLNAKYYIDFLADYPEKHKRLITEDGLSEVELIGESIQAYRQSIPSNISSFTSMAKRQLEKTDELIDKQLDIALRKQIIDAGFRLVAPNEDLNKPGPNLIHATGAKKGSLSKSHSLHNLKVKSLSHASRKAIWDKLPDYVRSAVNKNLGYLTYNIENPILKQFQENAIRRMTSKSSRRLTSTMHSIHIIFNENNRNKSKYKVSNLEVSVPFDPTIYITHKNILPLLTKTFGERLNLQLEKGDFKHTHIPSLKSSYFESNIKNYQKEIASKVIDEMEMVITSHDDKSLWINTVIRELASLGYQDGIGEDEYIHALANGSMRIPYLSEYVDLVSKKPKLYLEMLNYMRDYQAPAYVEALSHLESENIKSTYTSSSDMQLLGDYIDSKIRLLPLLEKRQ